MAKQNKIRFTNDSNGARFSVGDDAPQLNTQAPTDLTDAAVNRDQIQQYRNGLQAAQTRDATGGAWRQL